MISCKNGERIVLLCELSHSSTLSHGKNNEKMDITVGSFHCKFIKLIFSHPNSHFTGRLSCLYVKNSSYAVADNVL